MPATLVSICSRDSRTRSCDLPLGSPIMPGAAADDGDRRVTEALQARQTHHRQQRSDVQARRRRIEADVRGQTCSVASDPRTALPCCRTAARASRARRRGRHRFDRDLLYQSMAITRRAALKTLVAHPASALSAAPACTAISTAATRSKSPHATIPVTGLPPPLRGLRIGLMTDIHRSRWVPTRMSRTPSALLMAEQPDLVVLGGDYVTWGDPAVRRPVE